jgi:hypothetical protein
MPTGIPERTELHACPICGTMTNRTLYCKPECYNIANKHYAKNRSAKVRKSIVGKLKCLKCGKLRCKDKFKRICDPCTRANEKSGYMELVGNEIY